MVLVVEVLIVIVNVLRRPTSFFIPPNINVVLCYDFYHGLANFDIDVLNSRVINVLSARKFIYVKFLILNLESNEKYKATDGGAGNNPLYPQFEVRTRFSRFSEDKKTLNVCGEGFTFKGIE